MLELHEEKGLFYLGRSDRSGPGSFYSTYLYDKVEKPEDFAKLTLGSATAGRPAILGWGAAQVMLPPPEFYSAMERHVVDGIAGFPMTSMNDYAGYEIVEYIIDQPYYDSASSMIMNLDTFNSLPEDLQNLLVETFKQAEKELVALTRSDLAAAKQNMMDEGVEFYKLSPEVNDWYLSSAYNKGWELQQEKFPEVTPRLKELYTK
jgi:TRAP-type C4-dicarboxylate transport system substrate-binding protein